MGFLYVCIIEAIRTLGPTRYLLSGSSCHIHCHPYREVLLYNYKVTCSSLLPGTSLLSSYSYEPTRETCLSPQLVEWQLHSCYMYMHMCLDKTLRACYMYMHMCLDKKLRACYMYMHMCLLKVR